jgi:hypothetical protein
MGVPTDREVVTLLRARLQAVYAAVGAFFDAVEKTGQERLAAFEAMKAACASITGIEKADEFIETFERTMPERYAAFAALHEAMKTDFRTALLMSDLTEDQLTDWFAESASELAPLEGVPSC